MMSEYCFGTKAETLDYLYHKGNEIEAEVLRPFFFDVKKWQSNKEELLIELEETFEKENTLIVRSSARSEDSINESLAGKFKSVFCENNCNALANAIDEVIASYGKTTLTDQVLIQKAIKNVECSGVAFTMDPNTGGRYFVINYDDSSGSTSSITSGDVENSKLFYWFCKNKRYPDDERLSRVCHTLEKLIYVLQQEALDVEFLFSNEKLYVLQARPLVLNISPCNVDNMSNALERISHKIMTCNKAKPYLFGERTIYGVMPDWNPAEMIGIHPRNLATSLYKEIITDDVWAYQRDNYGYKKLRSFPLMVDFCGYPYIDVRVSFNSFIPATLNPQIAEKLVDYYLTRLEEAPEKHDKVEFDIVFSGYTFDLPKRIQILKEYGFTEKEIDSIVNSLRNLTRNISNNENGLWRKDLEKLSILEARRNSIENSSIGVVEKIFWLLEDCKRYGTLPFAGLARAGFIAVQLLKSMVAEGIISQEENDAFMNDLATVGSKMKNDYSLMCREDFLEYYGFLRPGTYDICSSRYDEAPQKYFDWKETSFYNYNPKNEKFKLSLIQMEKIRNTLVEHGMGEDVLGLFSFIKAAIEGREWAKFSFSHNVSDALKMFGEWGELYGFSREEMSYADIQIIKDAYCGTLDEKILIRNSIESGKVKYYEGQGIVMPPLIVSERDITEFYMPNLQPNFITQQRTEGELCKDITDSSVSIDDKIVMIEAADPGYDWIFSHKIKGFITKYGGANSHMAIRAGELSIPAVVGAGPRMYDSLLKATVVEIDAPKKIVRVLR